MMHAVAPESARVLAVGTGEVRESSTRDAEMIADCSRMKTAQFGKMMIVNLRLCTQICTKPSL